MSRNIALGMLCLAGFILGSLITAGMSWRQNVSCADSRAAYSNEEGRTGADSSENVASVTNQDGQAAGYHFRLERGVLSVIEGSAGADGSVIVTGLQIDNWPEEILAIVPGIEFDSLDNVQSFIDTVSEDVVAEGLWSE